MTGVADLGTTRSARYAAEFEAAQDAFIRLVESLTEAQWRLPGRNYPERLNGEDEGRPVGVIAHHVAVSEPFVMDRILGMLEGRQLSPVDIRGDNARHAAEQAEVGKEEVLRLLRESRDSIAAAVRSIPDDQLDQQRDTPVGPMSVAQRLERVLIGHLKVHQGSIEAAIS
jgi:hypothetical protein